MPSIGSRVAISKAQACRRAVRKVRVGCCGQRTTGNADAQALLAALYVPGWWPRIADGRGAGSRAFSNEIALANLTSLLRSVLPRRRPRQVRQRDRRSSATFWPAAQSRCGMRMPRSAGTRGRPQPAAPKEVSALPSRWPGAAGRNNGCRIADEVRRAADADLPTATYLLAVLTEHGFGVTSDLAAAARLYQQAAEKGLPSAQFRLGLALIDGSLVDQDPVAGEAWTRRAALAGNVEAAYFLGDRNAKSRPPDFAEAATWYRRAAEAGHQAAARALASLYLTGNGVAKDEKEGTRWLRTAANSGNQAAQVDLANLVLGGAGEPADTASVARWFEAAALSGDLIAAFNLGLCFTKGVGVRQDEGQAAQWLRRAAEGVAEAQYMYGRILRDGRGVAADAYHARAWFAEAAEGGVLDAQSGTCGDVAQRGRRQALAGGRREAVRTGRRRRSCWGNVCAGGAAQLRRGPAGRGRGAEMVRCRRRMRARTGPTHAGPISLPRSCRSATRWPARWLERAAAQGIQEATEELEETVTGQKAHR